MTNEQVPIELEVTGITEEAARELLDLLLGIPGVEILRVERWTRTQ